MTISESYDEGNVTIYAHICTRWLYCLKGRVKQMLFDLAKIKKNTLPKRNVITHTISKTMIMYFLNLLYMLIYLRKTFIFSLLAR